MDCIPRGPKKFWSRKSPKVVLALTSTRCVATVYIMLLYMYLERRGAHTLRFLRFLVTDLALSICTARGPKYERS